MKTLIALVVVAGLGAVAGAIYVGARVKEPTVVDDPYQAGLHYDEMRHAHDVAAVGTRTTPRPGSRAAPGSAESSCDVARGPCASALEGAAVTLDVAPRPPRTMAELEFTVDARRGALPISDGAVEIALTMPGMYMGENRIRLAPLGGGRYRGRGVLVRCPSGRKTWKAEVTVAPREPATAAPLRTSFTFDVAE